MKGDKYLFEQVKDLKAPNGYLEACFSLLWFKSRDVNPKEAAWILDTALKVRKTAEKEVRQLGFKLPDITNF